MSLSRIGTTYHNDTTRGLSWPWRLAGPYLHAHNPPPLEGYPGPGYCVCVAGVYDMHEGYPGPGYARLSEQGNNTRLHRGCRR